MKSRNAPIARNLPVFILGTQRSGTTLLCRMLTAHPDVFVQNELDVRRIFDAPPERSRVLDNIRALIEQEQGLPLTELLAGSGKGVWGLKDPELTYHLDALELFLPDTRVVVLVRDGRAVVSSYKKNKWGLGTNAYTGALRWQREVQIQLEFQRRHPEHVLVLQFENLLHDPSTELERVCAFLDLPFDEAMLDYHQRPVFYEAGRENRMTFERPDPSIKDKWMHELSERERSLIAHVCGPLLEKLGYAVKEKPYIPSRTEISVHELHQKIVGEMQLQYRWRMSRLKRAWRSWRDTGN